MKTWAGAVSGRGMSHGSVRVLGVLPMAVASFGVPLGVLGRMLLESECVCVRVSSRLATTDGCCMHTSREGKKEKKKRVGWARILSPAAGRLATRNAQHMSRLRRHTHEGGLPAQQPIRARIGAGWLLFPWARGRGEQPSWRVLQAAQAYPL
jgi:hypothetical protein